MIHKSAVKDKLTDRTVRSQIMMLGNYIASCLQGRDTGGTETPSGVVATTENRWVPNVIGDIT